MCGGSSARTKRKTDEYDDEEHEHDDEQGMTLNRLQDRRLMFEERTQPIQVDRPIDFRKPVACAPSEYQDVPVAVGAGRMGVAAQHQNTLCRVPGERCLYQLAHGRRRKEGLIVW